MTLFTVTLKAFGHISTDHYEAETAELAVEQAKARHSVEIDVKPKYTAEDALAAEQAS